MAKKQLIEILENFEDDDKIIFGTYNREYYPYSVKRYDDSIVVMQTKRKIYIKYNKKANRGLPTDIPKIFDNRSEAEIEIYKIWNKDIQKIKELYCKHWESKVRWKKFRKSYNRGILYESFDLYNYDNVEEFVEDNLDEKTLEYICCKCGERSDKLSNIGILG